MKIFVLLCLFGVAAVAVANPGGRQYTDRFDHVNLDEIIQNRRLLIPYILCALEQGRCTAEGKELRSHIREALENECALCTDAQRTGARRVIGHLINHESEYWKKLSAKYDPTGKYTHKYEKELRTVA